jgi:hypothetical protein
MLTELLFFRVTVSGPVLRSTAIADRFSCCTRCGGVLPACVHAQEWRRRPHQACDGASLAPPRAPSGSRRDRCAASSSSAFWVSSRWVRYHSRTSQPCRGRSSAEVSGEVDSPPVELSLVWDMWTVIVLLEDKALACRVVGHRPSLGVAPHCRPPCSFQWMLLRGPDSGFSLQCGHPSHRRATKSTPRDTWRRSRA